MKCPKCDSSNFKRKGERPFFFYVCDDCDYISISKPYSFDTGLSKDDMDKIREKGERFERGWWAEQTINKLKRGW